MDLAANLPVSPPTVPLPKGAWDCHAHVFGPFDRFPLHPKAPYPPPLATRQDYMAMLDKVGFAHGVLVHPSANGYDNATTADAVLAAPDRLVGVAVVAEDATDAQLASLHGQGFSGIRFTENGHPHSEGTLPLARLGDFRGRLAANGWHAQIWAKCSEILKQADLFASRTTPAILDHMGFFQKGGTVDDAEFRDLIALLRNSAIWVKLTPHRVSDRFPDCADVRAQHDAIVEAIPDRIVWGSDWPFIGMHGQSPDVGRQVDLFDQWIAGDATLRQKVMVDNPARFYRSRA
ncbi:amidohydrolase family protein [Gemmobacter sp.]|uniref:amidohydrolase family protein n=1 Tax=Gemmobacter sp. TaxID=1898957 RepID=UPI002AFE6A11|nr:amidohydrolase family protein [Gemmobacter sp.]